MATYTETTWAGKTLYECTDCNFDTLSLAKMQKHLQYQHIDPPAVANTVAWENDYLRAVVYTDRSVGPNNNWGGANIWELWYKGEDIVAKNAFGGGNTNMDLGSLGHTGIWEKHPDCPAYYDPPSEGVFYPFIGDNGMRYTHSDTELVDTHSYKFTGVVDGSLGNPLYALEKIFTLDGKRVYMKIKMTMLRDETISEPRVGFHFNKSLFDTVYLDGHHHHTRSEDPTTDYPGDPGYNCPGEGVSCLRHVVNTIRELDLHSPRTEDRCYGTGHLQSMFMDGKDISGINARLWIPLGFEKTKMFEVGMAEMGDTGSPSSELYIGFCGRTRTGVGTGSTWNVPIEIDGNFGIRWFPWWGGGPIWYNRWVDVLEDDVLIDDEWVLEVY